MIFNIIYNLIFTILYLGAIPFAIGSVYALFFLRKYNFRFVLLSFLGLVVTFLLVLATVSLVRDGVVISLSMLSQELTISIIRFVFAVAGLFFVKRFFKRDKLKGQSIITGNKVFFGVNALLLLYFVYHFFHSPLFFTIESNITEHKLSSISASELNQTYSSYRGLFSFNYPKILIVKTVSNFSPDEEDLNLIYPPKNYRICSIQAQRKSSEHPFTVFTYGNMANVTVGENNWEKYTDSKTFGDTTWFLKSDELNLVVTAPNIYRGTKLCEKIVETIRIN